MKSESIIKNKWKRGETKGQEKGKKEIDKKKKEIKHYNN